jgi:hypothetical protein
MAESKKVLSSEIIEQDLFRNPIDSTKEFEEELDKVIKSLGLIKSESANVLKSFKDPKTSKEIKTATLELDKFNKAEQAQIKLEVEREKLKQAKLKTDAQILASQKKEEQEKAKQLKQQEKELENLKKSESAYNKASKQLNDLRQRYKDLAVEGKGASREAIEYLVQITKLDKELKDIDASVGQFNRSVGDYSNQVQDAIEKTGFFGDIIAKITSFVELFESVQAVQTSVIEANTVATEINTSALELNVAVTEAEILAHEQNIVALQAETVATEKLSLAKRVLNAITSPVGLILLAVGAVVALTKAVFDVNQSLQDSLTIGKAFAQDKFWGTGSLFQNLAKETIKFRKEINGLNEELQILNDNEGDLNFVYQDQTITLNERKKALEDYNKSRLEASLKGVEIAKRELDLANLALQAEESRRGVGKGKALQEFYDKQSESVQKLFDAEDKYKDLIELEIPKAQREFKEQTILDEIELIRSKKLGADSQVEILKKQVDDEKSLIAERKKSLQDLTDAQLKAQNEEFDLLEKFGIKRSELDALVTETDAVKLARDLDELGRTRISIAQKESLAKVILESQKNAIDRSNQQAKIDEKEIENKKTLIKLQNEIDLINKTEQLRLAKEDLDRQKTLNEKLLSDSLSQQNVFNSKKEQLVLDGLKKEQDLQTKAIARENELIKKKYDDQIAIIREGIKNKTIEENIGKKEIGKLTIQKENELAQNTIEINNKKEKYLADLRKQQSIAIVNDLQKVTDSLSQELDKRSQKQVEAKDRDIDKTQKAIQKQSELAQRGLDNQLAFEEQQLAKRELEKRQIQEREAKRQELIEYGKLYLSSYNARLQQPKADPNTAPFLALKDVFLAKGLAKSVQFFNEGTDYVTPKGQRSEGKGHDYIPAMLAEGEAVIPQTANDKNRTAVKSLIDGTFDQVYRPINDNGNVVYRDTISNKLVEQNSKIINTLEKISNKPVQQVNVNEFRNLVETLHFDTRKEVITYKTTKRRL